VATPAGFRVFHAETAATSARRGPFLSSLFLCCSFSFVLGHICLSSLARLSPFLTGVHVECSRDECGYMVAMYGPRTHTLLEDLII
jgi:hypothetical protein